MTASIRIRDSLLRGLIVVLALASAGSAKTLMWLVDWYQMGNIDTITKILSVRIPHDSDSVKVDGSGGYYFGKSDLQLTKTSAYATTIPVNTTYDNSTMPDSMKIPTQVYRNWYALPNFNSGNFAGGRIRVYLTYNGQMHHPQLSPPKMQIDNYPNGVGQTNQLEASFTDSVCSGPVKGDTVWIWSGATTAGQITSNPSSLTCLDHNPFFTYVGTVHVFNPWPGKTPSIQWGGVFYPTYADTGRPGWYSAALYTDPRKPTPFQVRIASGSSASASFLDAGGLNGAATGVPFDFTSKVGKEVWITPPLVSPTSIIDYAAPKVKLQLYIEDPAWSSTTLRTIWKGNSTMFVPSGTPYGNSDCSIGWFLQTFYEGAVPTSIVLHQPLGDTIYGKAGIEVAPASYSTFTNWIDLGAVSATGGVASLSTEGSNYKLSSGLPTGTGSCGTKYLAFSAWDFRGAMNGSVPRTDPFFYEPFSQLGPNNNVTTGGVTKGLVVYYLGANGLPVMNKAHAPAVGINTADSTDGPQFWFDTLWRNSAGNVTRTYSSGAKQLNSFYCYKMPLTMDASGTYYTYNNQSFWPLTGITSIPLTYRQFDTTNQYSSEKDAKFALHARAAFEYTPGLQFSFTGDDDVWIFIDKKLALYLGGQHGPQSGTIDLDKLGLVVGKSYQFDMFTAERQGDGSTIAIKTTMNLVPVIDVSYDSSNVGGLQNFKIWTTITTTRADVCPEEGSPTSMTKQPGKASYRLILPDLTDIKLDSTTNARFNGYLNITENGSRIAVDTAKLKRQFTDAGIYQIEITIGSDTRTITFSVVSNAVDVEGILRDGNGDGRADSVELHVVGSASAFSKTVGALLRWSDSAGVADSVWVDGASLARQPGDSAMSGSFAPLAFRTSCPPSGCTGSMGYVYTLQGGDTLLNKIKVLQDGIAPVADSAWLLYDTTGQLGAHDTLYVTTSEPITPSGAASPWVFLGKSSSPRSVTVVGTATGTLLKLAFDPSANPVLPGDSARLGGGVSDLLGNAPGQLSRWVPIATNSVAKSWIVDTTGDGTAESIHVHAKGDLSSVDSVRVYWRTVGGADTSFVIRTPGGLGSSLSVPTGALVGSTYGAGYVLDVYASGLVRHFPLLDSMAPVATGAELRYGTTNDTLYVTSSEVVAAGSTAGEGWFGVKPSTGTGSTSLSGSLVSGILSGTPTTKIALVVPSGSVVGDSLRLRGWSCDVFGNCPGPVSRWVPLRFGPQPIRVSVYDRDGDGSADSVVYRMSRSQGIPTPSRFGLVWNGVVRSPSGLVRSSDGQSWSGPVQPFPLATAPLSGDAGWLVVGDTDSVSYRARAEDSVPPVALSGKLVFGFDEGSPDTIVVSGSEGLSLSGSSYVLLNSDSTETGSSAPVPSQVVSASAASGQLRVIVASGSIAGTSRWVRFGTSVSDGSSSVGSHSRWVRLVVTPSGRAALYDADGDGRADSMHVWIRGTLPGGSATLHWSDTSGGADVRTWLFSGDSSGFGVKPSSSSLWFQKGATSCSSGGCHVVFTDASGAPLVDWNLSDSVAPIVRSGRYRFGSGSVDTLTLQLSESVSVSGPWSNPWLVWGSADGRQDTIHFLSGTASGATTLVGYLDSTLGARSGWDSVRFVGGSKSSGRGVSDQSGTLSKVVNPWAPLSYGLPPVVVRVTDPQGLGRGTDLNVRLVHPVPSQAISQLDSVRVTWSGEVRSVPVSGLSWDASSNRWSGSVGVPFASGATSRGSVYGAELSSRGSVREAGLEDGVPPALTQAHFRYSGADVGVDTLVLDLSEPWPGEAAGNLADAFATAGLRSRPLDVKPMLGWFLRTPQQLEIYLDTVWGVNLSRGDSARLAYQSSGSRVWDSAGNRVGVESPWVPIEFGLRPAEFSIKQEHPILNNKGDQAWPVPGPDVPPMEILVKGDDGTWKRVDEVGSGAGGTLTGGIPAKNDWNHVISVTIRLNRPLEGRMFVYDNLGTAVTDIDLSALSKLWPEGSKDAMRDIRITWNGVGPNGQFVASGVYLLRAVVKASDGEGHAFYRNLLWKYGWNGATK